ncbi:class I adenylate-forming enzyme family protein [Nocardia amikacinitolerans]|uniref:class I adenylate-forming enzyme family protein n=1 Tax=Nocardia amikacinitolerans TaxID=756689 RepID=UPI0026462F0C|nr:AMP-binding protein [Nocardia amikacinitolerans]MCP2288523.1 fatty-acyl-CoA synthase [Nocardia amikacinitolerans]
MQRIHDLLASAAETASSSVGWVFKDRELSFGEMQERSDRIAAGLLRNGIRPGDRVAVLGTTTPDWIAVYFAAAKIGAALVGLSVRYRETELAHIISDSGARMVITVPSHESTDFLSILAKLRRELPQLETVVTFGEGGDSTLDELLAASTDNRRLAEVKAAVSPRDPVMIIYTSGTTGKPKGATLTHGGQLAAAQAQARHMRLHDRDVLPAAVPLDHVSGITCCVLAALVAHSRVILLETFAPREIAALLETADLTLWVGVPTMHTLLLNCPELDMVDTSKVRLVVTGGANAEPALLERLTTRFPNATVMNLYGLSEASGAVVMTSWDDDRDTLARSIGRPLAGVEVKIADTAGTELPIGQTGELMVRSPSLMAGYHNMPHETADVIDEGWLHTGDMAYVSAQGSIVLRGRAKEMFVQGGFNVYPIEVENVLTTHSDVIMAAGVGVPDPVLGEIGRYYVVLAPEAETTEEDLKAFCSPRIADYKIPKEIMIRAELPLTPAGKIQKSSLDRNPRVTNPKKPTR